jgi:methyl-accepting chemotaxis protein
LTLNDPNKAVDYGLNKMPTLYDCAREQLAALVKIQMDEARNPYNAAEKRSEVIYWSSIASVVIGLILATLAGYFLMRKISRVLTQAVDVSNRIGSGDLTLHILETGHNKIGALPGALRNMRADLVSVVSAVRSGSKGVATAGSKISEGNNDLSLRTEQQAASLQETASSLEDLSNTIIQNSDNASQANQLPQNASAVAIDGGNVVNQVVETMKDINESSTRISEIIGVIDGIAFQTNILALNAAVEVARAGKQGRGFAVVASEVRSLASQSVEAAKQIKALIGASVVRVEQGTRLADKAGATMVEVVGSIRRVTDIIAEINAASSEQAFGVQQVNAAVRQMDQTTQQNAALVEQIAAAASSLKVMADEQFRAVATFSLPQVKSIQSTTKKSKVLRLAGGAR